MKSGIILVGGEARRAGGQEKYFFEHRGETFIDRLINTLGGTVDETIIVAKDKKQCRRFSHITDVTCITDIRRGMGPIGGLHAGALAAKGDTMFVVACDMPCISREVIEYLFSQIDNYDAVIPCWNRDMLEPLHAVYRRAPLLAYLEKHESLSLRAMVRCLNTRYVDIEGVKRIDPSLRTFTNINRIEDLHHFNGKCI